MEDRDEEDDEEDEEEDEEEIVEDEEEEVMMEEQEAQEATTSCFTAFSFCKCIICIITPFGILTLPHISQCLSTHHKC